MEHYSHCVLTSCKYISVQSHPIFSALFELNKSNMRFLSLHITRLPVVFRTQMTQLYFLNNVIIVHYVGSSKGPILNRWNTFMYSLIP